MKWVGYNQMLKDRQRRDELRANLQTDIDHIKAELKATNLAKRGWIRLQEGATEIYEETEEFVSENRGLSAIIAGAIALVILRKPLSKLFNNQVDHEGDQTEDHPNHPQDHEQAEQEPQQTG